MVKNTWDHCDWKPAWTEIHGRWGGCVGSWAIWQWGWWCSWLCRDRYTREFLGLSLKSNILDWKPNPLSKLVLRSQSPVVGCHVAVMTSWVEESCLSFSPLLAASMEMGLDQAYSNVSFVFKKDMGLVLQPILKRRHASSRADKGVMVILSLG